MLMAAHDCLWMHMGDRCIKVQKYVWVHLRAVRAVRAMRAVHAVRAVCAVHGVHAVCAVRAMHAVLRVPCVLCMPCTCVLSVPCVLCKVCMLCELFYRAQYLCYTENIITSPLGITKYQSCRKDI